jgi:uncharacterized FAD-dependent dehydrogenase
MPPPRTTPFVFAAGRDYHFLLGNHLPVPNPLHFMTMVTSRSHFDAIIVGAGPAGIFAALELVRGNGLRVLVLEKGPDIARRTCPARTTGTCSNCRPCDITCGWGGAGAFSDGKLTLSPAVGGWLTDFVTEAQLTELIGYVDTIWRDYGAPDEVHGGNARKTEQLRREALLHGITLVASPVRHMGTERAYDILTRMRQDLEARATGHTRAEAVRILPLDEPGGKSARPKGAGGDGVGDGAKSAPARRVAGVALADGTEFTADAVIVAPGRQGAAWMVEECRRLGLKLHTNAVDIGVRVEVPAVVMEPLTSVLYESKLIYNTRTFDDQVRTFCMNPYGEVSLENYGDVLTVNGHSYASKRTQNTNFALLVNTQFTEPFDDPIAYGKSIARLANLLGEDILVQRLGDLQAGKRSTRERIERGTVHPTLLGATPGDLSFVLPYRYLKDILEMLEAMDFMAPGVKARDTLLYGAEVKFYSARPQLDAGLQTEVAGLYAVGDGAGVTRGLVQASAAGVMAARSILDSGTITATPASARATTAPAPPSAGTAATSSAPVPADNAVTDSPSSSASRAGASRPRRPKEA